MLYVLAIADPTFFQKKTDLRKKKMGQKREKTRENERKRVAKLKFQKKF